MTGPNLPIQYEMTLLDADDGRSEALKRLLASRVRLQSALMPPSRRRSTADDSDASTDLPRRARALWRMFKSRSSGGAYFSTALSLMRQWWESQPWHPTSEVLGQAVAAEISPWVKSNPVKALAMGAVAGAALAAARPWRWRVVNSQTRVMARSISRWAMGQLTQVPVQMALTAALAAWLEQRRAKPSGAETSFESAATTPKAAASD